MPAGRVNVGLETLAPVIVFLTVVPSDLFTKAPVDEVSKVTDLKIRY
jgi:hypothetical protein